MRVLLQPAFVLHSRVYRDTSLLVEVLTRDYGRLTLVARGVRGARSRLQGILVPFLPLLISFGGKTDLKTLQQAEVDGASFNLVGDILLSGFYLNELLVKLLPRYEPHEKIYSAYKETLVDLTSSEMLEIELRLFEKCLLVNLGYGLELSRTVCLEPVLKDKKYMFEFGVGVSQVDFNFAHGFDGGSLLALHENNLTTKEHLSDAKRLLRKVFATLLGNKDLKSRELFFR